MRMALMIIAGTSTYSLSNLLIFSMPSFFLASNDGLCIIRFNLHFSFCFSSERMDTVMDAIDSVDKVV